MPVDRIQVGGTNPSPDRQDFNLVAGTGVTIAQTDDTTAPASKATFSVNGWNHVAFPVVLSSVVTGSIVARFTPGFAGTIKSMSAFVYVPVVTTSKLATLTPAISAVSMSGAAVAINSTAAATLGNGIAGSSVSGLGTFTATQEITVVASAVTQFAEGQVVLNLFYQAS